MKFISKLFICRVISNLCLESILAEVDQTMYWLIYFQTVKLIQMSKIHQILFYSECKRTYSLVLLPNLSTSLAFNSTKRVLGI